MNLKSATLALAPLLLPLLTLPTVVIVLGVVLPAVWSTVPARRRAACAVLSQLLAALPHRHNPSCDRWELPGQPAAPPLPARQSNQLKITSPPTCLASLCPGR